MSHKPDNAIQKVGGHDWLIAVFISVAMAIVIFALGVYALDQSNITTCHGDSKQFCDCAPPCSDPSLKECAPIAEICTFNSTKLKESNITRVI